MPASVKNLPLPKRLGIQAGLWLFRLITATLKVRISPSFKEFANAKPHSAVVLLWHNRLALALATFRRVCPHLKLTALVSASGDGAALSTVMDWLGIATVRGSSSRRAVEATRELLEVLQAGSNVVITPDGPRGPVYVLKEGAAELARTQTPVTYLVGFRCSRAWTLGSWDRFIVPQPFATIHVDLIKIDHCTLTTAELQSKLNEITGVKN